MCHSFQVKKFGPLWATSSFCFESFNGEFVRNISSGKGPAHQLSQRFLAQRYAHHRITQVERKAPAVEWIINRLAVDSGRSYASENSTRLGNRMQLTLSASQGAAFLHSFGCIPHDLTCSSMAYVIGQRFSSVKGQRGNLSVRQRSYSFKYSDMSDIVESEQYALAEFFVLTNGTISAVCKRFDVISRTNINTVTPPINSALRQLYDDDMYGTFFPVLRLTVDYVIVDVEDIICKVVLVPYGDLFVGTDVLPFEHD